MEFQTIRFIKDGCLHLRKLFFIRSGAKAEVVYDLSIPGYAEYTPTPEQVQKIRRNRRRKSSSKEAL